MIKFKTEIEINFKIKSNCENIKEILEIISNNVSKELNEKIKDKTNIEVIPIIKKIEAEL